MTSSNTPLPEMNDAARIMGHLTAQFQPQTESAVFLETSQKSTAGHVCEKRIYKLSPSALARLRNMKELSAENLAECVISCGGSLTDMVDENGQYIPAIRSYDRDGALQSIHYYRKDRERSPAADVPSVMTIENGVVVWGRHCDEVGDRRVLEEQEIAALNKKLALTPYNPLIALKVPMIKGATP